MEPANLQLKWYTSIDRHHRQVHEASSIYHDDGAFFDFRIIERRKGKLFVEASDHELLSSEPRTWKSLDAAKAAMQAEHEAMIADESAIRKRA